MSEEDAFLNGIAADRADRTRLLVFADWLADRADPREEFVRVHERLLDMHGTEKSFAEAEKTWAAWTGGIPFVGAQAPRLNARWLDALCRVCTAADVEEYAENGREPMPLESEVLSFGPTDHTHRGGEVSLNLYRGLPGEVSAPFEFAAESILVDLWEDPFLSRGASALASCLPLTRGRFWNTWRELVSNLHEPPELPVIAANNYFLGAQLIYGDWNNWGAVAIHRDEYFALVWSTTA